MLVDTSGWFCIFDDDDHRHDSATDLYRSHPFRLTHNYIIAELVPLIIARRKGLSKALDAVASVLEDVNVEIVWVDQTLTRRAIELLNERRDKTWSICDAVSFILMSEFGLNDALTTDHHFKQAGFNQLLES
ncbi:MAG: type II toxin-antitoxin system VapC family toxin [Pyrinomonadaceae bacterium]|nr:type II toxin-antitoxin system VapC family toxin [Pyrinomonadaceae bacterium]